MRYCFTCFQFEDIGSIQAMSRAFDRSRILIVYGWHDVRSMVDTTVVHVISYSLNPRFKFMQLASLAFYHPCRNHYREMR